MEKYNKSDPKSIEKYAKKLVGKTFNDVINEDDAVASEVYESDDFLSEYESTSNASKKGNKGRLGQVVEEHYFHYHINSDQNPDFKEAGVELKVTCYKKNKNGDLSAKERVVITMIDYFSVINETFYDSHVWDKCKLMLLIYYLYDKAVKDRYNYRIGYVSLFTPPKEDLPTIESDFNKIVQKVRNGKAHELSEGDTDYLGAVTKGANANSVRVQPFSDIPAKQRAFAFKEKYMTHVLNHYIIPNKDMGEYILDENENKALEEAVIEKVDKYSGMTEKEICEAFDIDYEKKPKQLEALLAYRILGIKGNKAEEFEKANIIVKTIRIGKNDKIKESMSFPTFKFKELVNEEWETSDFFNYLSETRFLFVVYKYNKNDELVLKGCQFWNIPYDDLQEVKKVWIRTKQVLIDGLEVKVINNKRYNNFPGSSENPVCHVRPHAQNAQDTYELPDGRMYPKQCFWLNNTYVLSQIQDRLK